MANGALLVTVRGATTERRTMWCLGLADQRGVAGWSGRSRGAYRVREERNTADVATGQCVPLQSGPFISPCP